MFSSGILNSLVIKKTSRLLKPRYQNGVQKESIWAREASGLGWWAREASGSEGVNKMAALCPNLIQEGTLASASHAKHGVPLGTGTSPRPTECFQLELDWSHYVSHRRRGHIPPLV